MIKILFLFSVIIFAPAIVAAQGEATDELSGLISEALRNNPQILSSRKSFEAAASRISQAGSLSDPMIEYEYDRLTADRGLSGKPMTTFAVSQEVPFPTKLYFRAKIAAKLAKMAHENYLAKERAVIAQLKSVYAEFFNNCRTLAILQEDQGTLEQLVKTANTRYSLQQGSQADILRVQVELSKLETTLIQLKQKNETLQAELNVLLGRDPSSPFPEPGPGEASIFDKSLTDLVAAAKISNPELQVYQYAVEKGKAALGLAHQEFLPDFTLRYRQMWNKNDFEQDNWAGMVGATIPLWSLTKQAQGVKEMRADFEMLKADYQMKENEVIFAVRDAFSRVEANKKIVLLYETVFLPQAQHSLNSVRKAYETGKEDFRTLLDSQRMLTEFKLAHYQAIMDLRIAFADLEQLVGNDILKNKE